MLIERGYIRQLPAESEIHIVASPGGLSRKHIATHISETVRKD